MELTWCDMGVLPSQKGSSRNVFHQQGIPTPGPGVWGHGWFYLQRHQQVANRKICWEDSFLLCPVLSQRWRYLHPRGAWTGQLSLSPIASWWTHTPFWTVFCEKHCHFLGGSLPVIKHASTKYKTLHEVWGTFLLVETTTQFSFGQRKRGLVPP